MPALLSIRGDRSPRELRAKLCRPRGSRLGLGVRLQAPAQVLGGRGNAVRLAGLLMLVTFGACGFPGTSEEYAQATGDDGVSAAAAAWRPGFQYTGSLLPNAEPPSPASEGGDSLTEGDNKWINSGYSLFWHSTPDASDVGKPVMDYFNGEWRGKHPLKSHGRTEYFSVVNGPGGTPAVKGFIPKGDSTQRYVVGNQFGPNGISKDKAVVFSSEWYRPCVGGQQLNNKGGSYIGFGPNWGSADGVNAYPGGGTGRNDSWNVRITLSGTSNNYAIYYYIPGLTQKGSTSSVKPGCDRWERIEAEVIQNDLGKSNGSIRLYVDGKLIREKTGLEIQTQSTFRPKGFGIMLKHNHGAPQDETYYWRNWRLYVK